MRPLDCPSRENTSTVGPAQVKGLVHGTDGHANLWGARLKWVITRHSANLTGCPPYPRMRTSDSHTVMSALGQMRSFDHLVGDREEFIWDSETKRLGCLEIEDQLKPGRLLNRQIGWFCSAKNLIQK